VIPLENMNLYMTRIMHLIIIGENLPQLSHLHPTFEDNGENFGKYV
jgi:hypothetical protein